MTAGVLLDVTRTVSRAGLGPATGIDRVERAWIARALGGAWGEARFLARLGSGVHEVDAGAMRALLPALDGAAPPPAPDLRARLSLRRRPLARAVEAGIRRRATPPRRAALYVNVGHSNLTQTALAAVDAARRVVLIHDAIPLDHPEFARPEGPEAMRARLRAAARADAVIYNSAETRRRAEAHMALPPPGLVAPLGVDPGPVSAAPHDGFVVLGTIEPRKNHALLLDVWERMRSPPPLHIVGRRGWMNEAVFARLDRRPRGVVEHGAPPDGAARRLLAGARALLFPSLAEGYGLPLAEALALGVPVIAADLPALREVGGAAPLWLDPGDPAAWTGAVAAFAARGAPAARLEAMKAWRAPTWEAHFAAAERALFPAARRAASAAGAA